MRDSFIFYRSFYEALCDLTNEEQLIVYQAIADYSLNLIEPKLTKTPNAIFKLIKPQIDANNKRFENGKKGGSFGQMGGQQKKEVEKKPKKTPQKQKENQPEPQTITKDYSKQDFIKFVEWYNTTFKKKYKALPSYENKFKAILKVFSKQELINACKNAHADTYHIETNFKYLTIEFILRPDKVNKYKEEVKTISTNESENLQKTKYLN